MLGRNGGQHDTIEFASREQGFFDRSLGVRLLIGILFVACLFLFLHFREVRVEVLELNSVAPRYIVAQVDFSFFDEESTILLRQEAVRDIGKVFQISESMVHQRRTEFEKYLLLDQHWREKVQDSTFEEMYRGIDLLEHSLLSLRFTDPRTLKKMEEADLPTDNYQILPNEVATEIVLPATVWSYVENEAFSDQQVHKEASDFILDYFRSKPWKIEEDLNIERTLRKRVQARVPDKYTKVQAGSRIIDQGEKVTARHIAMLQAMKKALGDSRNLWHPLTIAGSLVLAIMLTTVSAAYLIFNQEQVMHSNRQLFLLVTIVLLTLGLSKVVEFFLLTTKGNLLELVRYPLLIPFAAILLCSLMNSSIAAFASGFLAVVLTMTLPFERQGFMITNLGAALVAILTTRTLKKRKDIFSVAWKAWGVCVILIVAIHFYDNTYAKGSMIADLFSTGIFMTMTAIIVVGLLPLLESGFNIMTNVTLMEYMDPNHPLLRRMTIESPGTYQHSIVVGNLAEACASSIGANGLFCRVATLFHDIGKMVTPQYFTENQQGGVNIHQLLTPHESAQVIMAHVSEGVSMARKAGLPERFIDIIKEHHGTTLVYYFYRKQLELMANDASLVDERDFRYAGPKPRSKESAIIMIADSFEAASRSLEHLDEESLLELINRLVREKAEDGQFDECQLTFQELGILKRAMVKTFVAAGHSRIKYPQKPMMMEGGGLRHVI